LPNVPGTGGVSESSATKEQELVSQSVSQHWRLERPHCVFQGWEQMFRRE